MKRNKQSKTQSNFGVLIDVSFYCKILDYFVILIADLLITFLRKKMDYDFKVGSYLKSNDILSSNSSNQLLTLLVWKLNFYS